MTRLLTLCGLVATLAAPAVAAAGKKAPAAPGPSAAKIVEQNVKARGGLKAWQAVATLKLSGEVDAGGTSDARLPFVLSMKRPHKSRMELTFGGKNAVQAYDGAQGWKVRPFLNRDDVEPYTVAEARSAAATDELDGPLVDYASKGTQIEKVGTEVVEGKRTYKLQLKAKSGEERFVWIDAKTFLEAKITGEPRKLDGRTHRVALYYRDYRTVDGLKIPHVMETVVDGVRKSHKMIIKTVTVNPALDDALFAKPRGAVAKAAGG